ncbi:MAG: hypothetical protein M0Q91_16810 [Methanoregula sp.]|nr:hypothetical protein [Methanoregula sp.]
MIAKEGIYQKVTELRERFTKDTGNISLAVGISNVFIEGYLTALVDTGIITKEEMGTIIGT